MPKIIHGMPNADYHASPAISKSGLDKIAKSPAHYRIAALIFLGSLCMDNEGWDF